MADSKGTSPDMNWEAFCSEGSIKKQRKKHQIEGLEAALSKAKDRVQEEKKKHEDVQKAIDVIKDIMPCTFFTVDTDLKITSWNRHAEKATGYTVDEALGKRCPDFAGTPCRGICDLFSCAPGNRKSREEDTITTKDGRTVSVRKNFSLLRNGQGDVVGGIEIFEDITKRKKLLKQLTIFRKFVDASSHGLGMADLEGTITYVNSALCGFLEADKPEDIIGNKFFPYYPQKMQKKIREEIIPTLMEKGSWTGELELISPGGSRRQTLENFFLIRDADGSPAYIADVISDITIRKNTEKEIRKAYEQLKESQEQVIQAAKMAAVGQLAGGVAHEVKNPLAVILHCAEYLERVKEPDSATLDKMVKMIKRAVVSADNIVRGLLDFSKPDELEFGVHDINDIVQTSLEFGACHLSLTKIKIEKELSEDIPRIAADHKRMEQVFLNLITNAVHAMPGGGTLTLRTYMKELTESGSGVGRRDKDRFKIGDKAVIVELIDTGEGIPEDKLGKVFAPFYSTKDSEKGTGLGLAITRTIVAQHKGFISMDSEVGKGTKVTMLLPLDNGK